MSVANEKSRDRNISLKVSIPENVDPAIESSLKETAEKVLAILARSGSQASIIATADRVAQAMLGTFQPDPYLVEERMDRLRSIRNMLCEGKWLTAAEINAAQENPPAQKSLPASDWKRGGGSLASTTMALTTIPGMNSTPLIVRSPSSAKF